MTYEQTREIFMRVLNENAGRHLFKSSDLITAISALDKQIPKIPKWVETEPYYWVLSCPNCLKSIADYFTRRAKPLHCMFCGQAIDRGDT